MYRVNMKVIGAGYKKVELIELVEGEKVVDITNRVLGAEISVRPTGVNVVAINFVAGDIDIEGLDPISALLSDSAPDPAPNPSRDPERPGELTGGVV